jgi:hypothetical protein
MRVRVAGAAGAIVTLVAVGLAFGGGPRHGQGGRTAEPVPRQSSIAPAPSPIPSPSGTASGSAPANQAAGARSQSGVQGTQASSPPKPDPAALGLPLRAAFYYPWFPEGWSQQGLTPFTHYHPTLGWYDSSRAVVRQQIAAMQYGNIQAGIASWWGQGSRTDQGMAGLLADTTGTGFRWAVYYEPEGQGDPSVSQLQADLAYLNGRYASDPGYLRLNGRFVVFVYAQSADGCNMADRWKQANTVGAYIVLKVFEGYAACSSQPDAWHQYAPAGAADSQAGQSFSISPGFFKANELMPRLARDPARWAQNVRDMVASRAPFQLVTTFNEWGEGTAVESATEWATASGYGAYLDALHAYR